MTMYDLVTDEKKPPKKAVPRLKVAPAQGPNPVWDNIAFLCQFLFFSEGSLFEFYDEIIF